MPGSMPTIVGSVEVSDSTDEPVPGLDPGAVGDPAPPAPAMPGVVGPDAPEPAAVSGFAVPDVDVD